MPSCLGNPGGNLFISYTECLNIKRSDPIVSPQYVDRAIVLAAGDGGRLGHLTKACPKALLPVGEKEALIVYPIEALAAAGISRITIVVGYLADEVRRILGRGSRWGVELEYVYNPSYMGGTAVSVVSAREKSRSKPVVVCMGDHMIEAEMVRRLVSNPPVSSTLCVDYQPSRHHDIDEATKVSVSESGDIGRIGKELRNWDALDTGVFLLTDEFFQAADSLIARNGIDTEITDVICYLVSRRYRFKTCDVSGCRWMDVDTPEDFRIARA